MAIRRSGGARSRLLLLVTLAAATPAPAPATGAAPANPFEELARVEEARLAAGVSGVDAAGPLLALFELAAGLEAGRFDPVVERLVSARGGTLAGAADRLLAARARDWLARRAEEKGDDAAAAAWRAPLGQLSRFWVVGPFGDGRSSAEVVYPPETEVHPPDVALTYVGKERNVGWRRAEGALRRGALDLSALLRPDTQAAAYAQVFVRVDAAQDVALRLGTPGAVKVWCNGALAYAADRVRGAHFDQDAVGMRLRAGWNRLLIKTVVTEGAWRVYARLTKPDGGRLAFTEDWAAPGASSPAGRRRAERTAAVPVEALEPLLRERVRKAPSAEAAARAGVDLGRYLMLVDPADRDRKEAAAAFEAAAARSPSVDAWMGLASVGREADESRRALERALAVARLPLDRARVLAALGDVARDQHRDELAAQRWRAALEADSRWWPANLSLAAEEQSAGFLASALARLDSLPGDVRAVPLVARERARLLMALDRRADAEGLWRALYAGARDNVDLLRDLAAAARARGDGAGAIPLMARAAALRPDLPALTVDWARALEGTGDAPGARRTLEAEARQ
ncbi:MAG: hypothetical protein ABUS79_10205, partial [Pseudomonadota bacterium]